MAFGRPSVVVAGRIVQEKAFGAGSPYAPHAELDISVTAPPQAEEAKNLYLAIVATRVARALGYNGHKLLVPGVGVEVFGDLWAGRVHCSDRDVYVRLHARANTPDHVAALEQAAEQAAQAARETETALDVVGEVMMVGLATIMRRLLELQERLQERMEQLEEHLDGQLDLVQQRVKNRVAQVEERLERLTAK